MISIEGVNIMLMISTKWQIYGKYTGIFNWPNSCWRILFFLPKLSLGTGKLQLPDGNFLLPWFFGMLGRRICKPWNSTVNVVDVIVGVGIALCEKTFIDTYFKLSHYL